MGADRKDGWTIAIRERARCPPAIQHKVDPAVFVGLVLTVLPVDGDEQGAPGGFVGHLRQVLDSPLHEARLAEIEGIDWGLGFADIRMRLGLQLAQV